jgi:aryl-alcohol dehydrogenase-like predicted oxidoreductase
VEGGITFFDTADVYNGGNSEILTGKLLRRLFGMREEYVVATKVHGRMRAWQFAKAQAVARTRFVSMQDHYNLINREEEREMIPQCIDQGVAVIPWSPLARGMLTGNRTRTGEKLTTRAQTDAFADSLYVPELDFDVVERADEVAAQRGVSTAQVALAWLLARPGVTAPIVGATKLAHLEDALAAERLSLTVNEVTRLEERYRPHAVAGHQ